MGGTAIPPILLFLMVVIYRGESSMTNEDMALYIKWGDDSLIPALWVQIRPFIHQRAKQRLMETPAHMREFEEDLVQEGYFAMMEAIEAFDPLTGYKFLTYMRYPLMSCFNTFLNTRTAKGKKDPNRYAISLDAPIEGGEDYSTLGDLIIDPESEAGYLAVEDDDFRLWLNRFIRKAVNYCASGIAKSIMLYMLDCNASFTEACKACNVKYAKARSGYETSLRRIRHYMRKVDQRKAIRLSGLYDYLGMGGTGVQSFRNHGFTSATERIAIERADFALDLKRLQTSLKSG
jgi:DNA-directed RNA polymerase specialized sigma24 family protein